MNCVTMASVSAADAAELADAGAASPATAVEVSRAELLPSVPLRDRLGYWAERLYSSYEAPGGGSRLLPMEGLRGLAVVLVLFVHYHAIFGRYLDSHTWAYKLSEFAAITGHSGVDLFFLLSGYLIYGALLRRETPYLDFIRRRAQRIYPTFLAVFACYLVLAFIFPQAGKVKSSLGGELVYILQNLFLLPGILDIVPIITVAWSLSYEFAFYLSMPLLFKLTGMRGWSRRARVAFISGWALLYILSSFWSPHSRVRLVMFAAGALLAEARGAGWLKIKLNRAAEVASITLVVLGSVFLFLLETRRPWFSALPGLYSGHIRASGILINQGPWRVLTLGLCFFLLAACCFERNGFLARQFSWRPLRCLGNMSYSYYLVHGVTVKACMLALAFLWPGLQYTPAVYGGLFPAIFLATLVSSSILFWAVEKPFSLVAKAKSPCPNLAEPGSGPLTRDLQGRVISFDR